MKILRSTHTVNPALGGPIESIRQSSAALLRRGHEVEIISLDAPDDPWVRESAVPVHALGPGLGSYGYSSRFSNWIRERRESYDAVIVHGLWQYSSFGVWRALAGTTTPYFVFPHGMLDPWFKRTYPLKHIKKLLYWPWGEYRVLRDAAAVLFTSEEERRLARESFALYRCNERVVNYGTAAPPDPEAARAKFFEAFPALRGQPFFLFLGRLHEKKGCDLLIDAFAQLKNSGTLPNRLVMAGPCSDDGYLRRLREMAAGLGDAVLFPGMLSGDMKWGALSAADAFALPSHQENFGIAVAEALACGTPVLISNKINIWREIEADGAGLVENDDLSGTANLLKRWLVLPADKRATMRENARKCFAARFEIERATDSLLAVIANPSSANP
ncbi:MAG TPA: glycosyltransferase [Chthoniobacterales bacterium]|nr:glycosyltransferase [Chthoniobacterales bacterium]